MKKENVGDTRGKFLAVILGIICVLAIPWVVMALCWYMKTCFELMFGIVI